MTIIPEIHFTPDYETDIDKIPLRFGKYKGKTPNEIFCINSSYLIWLYENIEKKFLSKELYALAESEECVYGGEYESFLHEEEQELWCGKD